MREGAVGLRGADAGVAAARTSARARLRRPPPVAAAVAGRRARVRRPAYRPERMTLVISGPAPWLEKALEARIPPALHGRVPNAARPAPARGRRVPGPARAAAELPARKAMRRRPGAVDGVAAAARTRRRRRKPGGHGARRRPRAVGARSMGTEPATCWTSTRGRLPGGLASAIVVRFKLRSSKTPRGSGTRPRRRWRRCPTSTLVHIKGRLWWGFVHAVQEATIRTALGMESLKERASARRPSWCTPGESALISQVFDCAGADHRRRRVDFAARYLKPDASRSVLLVPDYPLRHPPPVAGPARRAPDVGGAEPTSEAGRRARPTRRRCRAAPPGRRRRVAHAPGARAARVQTFWATASP